MLDKYTEDQLKTIIENIAPVGLIRWSEELDKDLTDKDVLRKFRLHMDGLSDYFTMNKKAMRDVLKEVDSKEEAIAELMIVFDLNHYEAKLFVDRNWKDLA